MDKQRLKEYSKLRREQELLAQRINLLCSRDILEVAGTVKASYRNFPYTEHRVSVPMEDLVEADSVFRIL